MSAYLGGVLVMVGGVSAGGLLPDSPVGAGLARFEAFCISIFFLRYFNRAFVLFRTGDVWLAQEV